MAIVRLSGSGKQLQFIVSEDVPSGTILTCASSILPGLLNGSKSLIVLTRMPYRTEASRFPRSKVFVPESGELLSFEEAVRLGVVDAKFEVLSSEGVKRESGEAAFVDGAFEW